MDSGLDILEYEGEGYERALAYGAWRVAIINSMPKLLPENIYKRERHLGTDEAFVLLRGSASLHIGEQMECFPMETGKIYNVRCGVWHAITMAENSKVLVIENDDTGPENTEIFFLSEGKSNV